MLDTLFNEAVTVRRQVSRGVKGDVVFEEVLDPAGGPLPVKGRLERRRRRSVDKQGQEISVDATFICRKLPKDLPEIGIEDVLVTAAGEAYRVTGRDEDNQLFSSRKYLRLSLSRTLLPVPASKQDAP